MTHNSGNAIIIYALKALKEANLLNDIQIVVALMGDEEMPGVPKAVSRKKLIEEGLRIRRFPRSYFSGWTNGTASRYRWLARCMGNCRPPAGIC